MNRNQDKDGVRGSLLEEGQREPPVKTLKWKWGWPPHPLRNSRRPARLKQREEESEESAGKGRGLQI